MGKTFDLAVENGQVLLPGGLVEKVNIGVREGKIAAISTDHLPAHDQVDAAGCVVIPGAIDAHMHTFSPGYDFETIENGTKAAAKGGVTTIIDMPLDKPPTLTVELLRAKRQMAERESYVDFALFSGFIPENPDEIARLAAEGVGAYKLFLDDCAPPGMYPGLDSGQLLHAMATIAQTGGTAAVHAEDSFIIAFLSQRYRSQGRKDPGVWGDARPIVSELAGEIKTVLVAKETRCRTVLCHVSLPEAADLAWQAQLEGYEIYAETCPHYLLLSREDLEKDVRLKYNPPNRPKPVADRLWQKVAQGRINHIASDHGPLPKDSTLSIWEIQPGAGNGVETMVPLILTEAIFNRGIPLARIVDLFTVNPARVYGLYPRKGAIAVGSDADIVVLELGKERQIDAQQLCTLGYKWSPYDGWVVKVYPKLVILRGTIIVQEDELQVQPGFGHYVPVFR